MINFFFWLAFIGGAVGAGNTYGKANPDSSGFDVIVIAVSWPFHLGYDLGAKALEGK